jgi:hypothetical protein
VGSVSRVLFGRALAASTIERGVEVTLRYYLGMYLGEVLEQNGYPRDGLRDPLDLERVVDLNDYSGAAQIALVVVASPGTVGEVWSDGEAYGAAWDVRAGAIVDLGDRLDTREAAQLYSAAAGMAVSHQGVATVAADRRTGIRDEYDGHLLPLEGSSVSWEGERFRAVDRMRGVVAGEALFRVNVEGARSLRAPDLPPPGEPTSPTDREEPEGPDAAPVVPSLTIDRRTPTED